MANISGRYAVVGVGESEVGRNVGRTSLALNLEAATRAIADAGLENSDIDGVLTRPNRSELQFNYSTVVANRLGIEPEFTTEVALGGASSASMIMSAVAALEAGFCKTVLCVNGEVQTARDQKQRGRLTNVIEDFEKPFGMLNATVTYALPARRHMYEFGTTSEQFAAVAVACRKHASLNPSAIFREPITIEDHQASRMIVEPFHLFDCCPTTDAAGAVIITSAERARDLRQKPVYILGLGQANTHADIQYSSTMTTTAMADSSRRAYAMARLAPKDIDLACLYDCFTYVVLVTLEDYGFCEKGEGGAFVQDGRIELGGELPVNTGGGLLSHAHASGFLHITEAAIQMRGNAGARQVAGAETAIISGQCAATGINACLILGSQIN